MPDLRTNDVAEKLTTSYWTAWRLIKSGQIPAFKVGAHYRVREEDLRRYIEANRVIADGAR